jgi:4-diphosphocytidyl-2-C-methyl-D-erythritol kinase
LLPRLDDDMDNDTLCLKTPAKINLTLAVRGRRPDGFHEIESWVVPIGLYDELRFSLGPALKLEVEGGALPEDSSNLVWKAATALALAAGLSPRARIELQKSIPIGAGLGGGSSDAAATLRGLNELWALKWPIERLMPVADTLGSDVPFFLELRQAILRGRGEQIELLPTQLRAWVALVVPDYGLSTAEVYRRHAARPRCRVSQSAPWKGDLSPHAVMPALFNDLEPAAFTCEPRLAQLHAKLDGLGGRPVRMTGSGSGLFTLFDSQAEAQGWSEMARQAAPAGVFIHVVPML